MLFAYVYVPKITKKKNKTTNTTANKKKSDVNWSRTKYMNEKKTDSM